MQAGERNRGLSIIKSRGTAHSNQVRELLLSDEGVTLTDTYTAGGEVLMGTLRWEKESVEHARHEASEVAAKLKRVRLDAEEAELKVQLQALQVALEAKQVEKALLASTTQTRKGELSQGRTRMRELRGSDAAEAGSEDAMSRPPRYRFRLYVAGDGAQFRAGASQPDRVVPGAPAGAGTRSRSSMSSKSRSAPSRTASSRHRPC